MPTRSNRNSLARIGFSLSASFLLASFALIQAVQPPPPMGTGRQPYGERFFESPDKQFSMRAQYSGEDRTLSLISYYAGGAQPIKVYSSQPLRYWPTCVRELSNGVLLVAGKGARFGNTIIEVMRFGPPSLGPLSTPSAPVLIPGPFLEVDEIVNHKLVGKELVEEMQCMLPSRTKLLVRYHDSDDVYVLDVGDGTELLFASPTAKPGALHIPLLAQDGLVVWSRQRVAGGVVYGFQRTDVTDPAAQSRALLFDMDSNGSIETWSMYSVETYDAAGYSSPGTWVVP
jgi:hypothetical protein